MEEHELKINIPGLLKLLGSNIYKEPDVAIREMISNANDACVLRGMTKQKFAPRIDISYDTQTLTFADSGAGMTEEELHTYLAVIGQGLAKIKREELEEAGAP